MTTDRVLTPALARPGYSPDPRHQPAGTSELARLFALATEVDVDLADYILLAAATGARRSKLIALRWPDLDEGSVRISGHRARRRRAGRE